MDYGTFGKVADAGLSWLAGDSAANKNAELQKQFAKHGIRWRVEDAQKAGIHPLYALGAQTHSFAPVHAGGDIGSSLSTMGQDISGAVDATRTDPEKIDAYTQSLRALQLEKGGLENELLKSQIAQMRARGSVGMATGDNPYLISGQANSGLVNTVPMKREAVDPAKPSHEAGAISDIGYTRTASGGWAPLRSKGAMDRMDDDTLASIAWSIRNRLLPSLGDDSAFSPPFKAPPTHDWRFNILRQQYELVRKSKAGKRYEGSFSGGGMFN